MNTNFRKFYEKDIRFYQKVLENEDPVPEVHEFKLQLFKEGGYEPTGDEEADSGIKVFGLRDFNMDVTAILMDYDVENPRFGQLTQPDKLKVFFSIKEKEKAIQCYKDFTFNKAFRIPGARHKLYYVRPEEIFVKYGDIEAEKYYQEEEARKKAEEEYQL